MKSRSLAALALFVCVMSTSGCGAAGTAKPHTSPVAANTTTPSAVEPSTPTPSSTSSPMLLPSPSASATPVSSAAFAHLPLAAKPPFQDPSIVSCTGSPGPRDPVAVVLVHAAAATVLRDYADEDHPRNLCTFGASTTVDEILSPSLLTIVDDGVPAVVEIPSGVIHELTVQAGFYAVSPDLAQILWFASDGLSLHDSWDGNTVTLQRYPAIGGRCSAPDIDSKAIAFSRDGSLGYALWAENFADQAYLNVVGNHTNVYVLAPPAGNWPAPGGPLMAVWAPADALYFTKLGDVWSWTAAGGARDLKAGVRWIDPSISPDGTHIVYMSRDANGVSTVHLMDAATGAIGAQIGGAGFDLPYFLTNDLIWVHADIPGCVGGQPSTFVYDLRTKSLYPSALDWVMRTWPATSAVGG